MNILSQINVWVFLYVVYFIISFILWRLKIRFLGIQLYPLGFSVTHLNRFYRSIGQKYSAFLINFGDETAKVIVKLTLVITTLLVLAITLTILSIVFAPIRYVFTIFVFVFAGSFSVLFEKLSFNGSINSFMRSGIVVWLVIMFSIMIHEMFHGIMAGANELPIKSTGILVLPRVLYGGFVSLDLQKLYPDNPDYQKNGLPKEINEFRFCNKYRKPMMRTLSFGLAANNMLLVFGIILLSFTNANILIILAQSLILVNVGIIFLNALPSYLTDGGKLLLLYSLEYWGEKRFTQMKSLVKVFTKFIIYAIIAFLKI